jgi:hypothetical protein
MRVQESYLHSKQVMQKMRGWKVKVTTMFCVAKVFLFLIRHASRTYLETTVSTPLVDCSIRRCYGAASADSQQQHVGFARTQTAKVPPVA